MESGGGKAPGARWGGGRRKERKVCRTSPHQGRKKGGKRKFSVSGPLAGEKRNYRLASTYRGGRKEQSTKSEMSPFKEKRGKRCPECLIVLGREKDRK